MSELQILFIVVGCTVAGAAILTLIFARVRVNQTEDSWRLLADRHGLRYATEWEGKKALVVHGDLDGHAFLMENVEVGGGQQKHSQTQISLQLGDRLPAGLFLGPERFGKGVFKKMIVGEEIELGDAEFDAAVVIRGRDPKEVTAYMTDARRAAVTKLLEIKATVEDGRILLKSPKQLHNLQELELYVEEMRAAARVLNRRK
jgi:hypothetical protein